MSRPQHADLTRGNGDLLAIQGQEVTTVAQHTLRSSERLVAVWDELEPLAKRLVSRLRTVVEREDIGYEPDQIAKLLSLTATVIQKLGGAASNVMRASEGQAKLALLLSAGVPKRRPVGEQSQKQLIGTMIEVLKHIRPCPVCAVVVEGKVKDDEPPADLSPDRRD